MLRVMLRVILLIQIFYSFAQANTGFSRGNEFVATSIQGQVRVVCNGFNGTSSATFTCRDIVLDPNPYDYFVGPRNARLTKLDLVVLREDGSTRSKVMGYDGSYGKSRDAVNLWISTIFQTPLLTYGVNTIRYKIYSSDYNEGQYEGNFNVMVKRGPARQCPLVQYDSLDINDCSSQYSICQRYFEEYKNCR